MWLLEMHWGLWKDCWAEAEKDKNIIKLRKNWNVSTKGTLIRKYRVPSKAEGRKILNAICLLLSDDDSFVDVSTHKV
jgi:hypothetical protein